NLRLVSSRSGLAGSPSCGVPSWAGASWAGAACVSCSASPWVAADSVAAGPASAVGAGAFVVPCFAVSVMRSSFAHNVPLAADGPAAGLHRVKQGACLLGADGELRHADRKARRVLEPDVFDVHPGRAGGVEEAGELARAVGDDDLDHGKVPRLAAVLAGDAAGACPALVEQARDACRPGRGGRHPRGNAPEKARDTSQVFGDGGDDLRDRP